MISAHVPSLSLCRQLKALGYPQETEFYWDLCDSKVVDARWPDSLEQYVSAPLVSEMAEFIILHGVQCPTYYRIDDVFVIHIDRHIKSSVKAMPDAYATQCLEILKARKEKV